MSLITEPREAQWLLTRDMGGKTAEVPPALDAREDEDVGVEKEGSIEVNDGQDTVVGESGGGSKLLGDDDEGEGLCKVLMLVPEAGQRKGTVLALESEEAGDSRESEVFQEK